MKNLLYILLLTSHIFFAQKGFENGNALYQKGKYPREKIDEQLLVIEKKQTST